MIMTKMVLKSREHKLYLDCRHFVSSHPLDLIASREMREKPLTFMWMVANQLCHFILKGFRQ